MAHQPGSHIERQTASLTEKAASQTGRLAERQTDGKTDRHVDRYTDRQIDRQTDRQADADMQTNRQLTSSQSTKHEAALYHERPSDGSSHSGRIVVCW